MAINGSLASNMLKSLLLLEKILSLHLCILKYSSSSLERLPLPSYFLRRKHCSHGASKILCPLGGNRILQGVAESVMYSGGVGSKVIDVNYLIGVFFCRISLVVSNNK